MSEEIFHTPVWFEHLWKNGMQPKPHRYWLWPLSGDNKSIFICLHLIQHDPYSGLNASSTYYSCLFGPEGGFERLAEFDQEKWNSSIKILKGIPGSEFFHIYPLDEDSQWVSMMGNSLRSNGFWVKTFFCFGNWYQIVPEDGFKSYWINRPSALRNSVIRGKRRLDAAGSWQIDIHTPLSIGSLEELENAISAYEAVYAQSWKQPEPHKEFLPGLVRMAAQQGWMRLGLLWLDGRPVAAQLWLVSNKKANIYKLAYVKGVERFSAGSVLTAALMEHTMDIDRVHEVDYLSGDDSYKADWMAFRRERVGLIAFDLRKTKGWCMACTYFLKKIDHRMRRYFLFLFQSETKKNNSNILS